MQPLRKNSTLSADDVSQLIQTHYSNLMESFYELQSEFLSGIYKRYRSIETANIILCFARNVHLEIIRQREKDLNFNVSLENFWKNFNIIHKPAEKDQYHELLHHTFPKIKNPWNTQVQENCFHNLESTFLKKEIIHSNNQN